MTSADLQWQLQGLEANVDAMRRRADGALPGPAADAPRALLAPPPPPLAPPPAQMHLYGLPSGRSPSPSPEVDYPAPSEYSPRPEASRVLASGLLSDAFGGSGCGGGGTESVLARPLRPGSKAGYSVIERLPQEDPSLTQLLCGLADGRLSVAGILRALDEDIQEWQDSLPAPGRGSAPLLVRGGCGGGGCGGGGGGGREQHAQPSAEGPGMQLVERQLRAVCQSLAGLAARMFNWSISAGLREVECLGLWDLIVQYLDPCKGVDERIADTCRALSKALSEGRTAPSGHALTAGASRPASASMPGSTRPEPATQRAFGDACVSGAALAATGRGGGGVLTPLPKHFPGEAVDEVLVAFTVSREARRLNGTYRRKVGLIVNGRPVYEHAGKCIVHLDDGTWAVKEGADGDAGAFVYAFAEDAAAEPFATRALWQAVDDGDGFVAERSGGLTRGGVVGRGGST